MDKRDFLKKGLIGGAAVIALGTSSQSGTLSTAYKGWQISWSGWSYLQGTSMEIASWIAKKPDAGYACYAQAGDLFEYQSHEGSGVVWGGGCYSFGRGFLGFASGPKREKAAYEAYQRLLEIIDKVESGQLKP